MQHGCQTRLLRARVPIYNNEFCRQLIEFALTCQIVDENLRTNERIAAMIIVTRCGDDANVRLHISLTNQEALTKRGFGNRSLLSSRQIRSRYLGLKRSLTINKVAVDCMLRNPRETAPGDDLQSTPQKKPVVERRRVPTSRIDPQAVLAYRRNKQPKS